MALLLAKQQDTNISDRERWASLIGGGSLVAFGLTKRNVTGYALAALGGSLIYRGATGHCNVSQAVGRNTAARPIGQHVSIPYELGIRVDQTIFVSKDPEHVYRFWRKLDNLPKFMEHLRSVEVFSDTRSHWVAEGPAGSSIGWDAEIIHEEPNRMIGWRSLEGSGVDNAGSVHFDPVPGGTRVRVSLQYNPPAGALGAAVAKLFGQDPRKQVSEDLHRFKELMELGLITTKPTQKPRHSEPEMKKEKLWDRDQVTAASEESFPASDPPSFTPERV